VDDLLTGADKVQEEFELYQQSKELMVKGAFNLRKWTTNSTDPHQLINDKEEQAVVQPKTVEPIRAVKEEDDSFTKSIVGPIPLSKLLESAGTLHQTNFRLTLLT